MGPSITDLEMHNNIILNINYSHMGASHDPTHHDLDYNLFGMINSGEYQANTNDLVADPQLAGIPMSSNASDHKGSDLTLEDFVPAASEPIDTGTVSSSVPAYDIVGEARPQGAATDRGSFEAVPQRFLPALAPAVARISCLTHRIIGTLRANRCRRQDSTTLKETCR